MKKRADGRYCKQILVGYSLDGKRKMKTIYGKTIKEIERKEREVRNNLDNGLDLTQENILVKDWGRKWLKVYKRSVASGTYNMYQKCLENHIVPTIGDIPISKLRPIQIQEALNNILEKGYIRTAEIYKLTIKQIINQAVAEGLLVKSVCNNLDKIKSNREEKRVLTDFELKCISKTEYTDKEKLFIDILYYTGIRRGEALALTLLDIDKKSHTIKINKSLDIRENTSVIKEPKTKSGYREIPIPDLLFTELIQYISKHKTFYLFPMKNGEPSSRSSFRKMWNSIMKKTQCTAEVLAKKIAQDENVKIFYDTSISFTPHIFRHTYATNLYYANIDIKKAQYLLGHSSLEMTLKVYTHLDNTKKSKDIVNKINDFFSQSKVSQVAN